MDRKLPDTVLKTGTLILVAGPSGSGKDTLIDAARDHFGENGPIYFPRRMITRDNTTGEDHIAISLNTFAELQDNKLLFLHWEAHGLKYAVSRKVLDKLRDGKVVVLNISRQLVTEAREKWEHTYLVQINVDDDVLLKRLQNRGREDKESIQARFERRTASGSNDADYIIDNSGRPEKAIEEFIALVSKYI